VRAGIASVALLGLAIAMLLVRGAENSSSSFAGVWYSVFGAPVVFALVAVVGALVDRRRTVPHRLAAVTLAVPALVAGALLAWFIVAVVPEIAD
jgi:hypothetical protein